MVLDGQHVDLSGNKLAESRIENHARLRTAQTNRVLGLCDSIQRPGVTEEVRPGADHGCRARESARVQPACREALQEGSWLDVRGEDDARVDGVDGGEVALGLADGVVDEVKGVGGVGGLTLCFDGAADFGFLLGGEVSEKLAYWVELFGHAEGQGDPLAVDEESGGSAEEGVAALVVLGCSGWLEDESLGVVELRAGGLGFRGLRGCHWHCGWLWCCVDLGPGSGPTFGGGGGPTFECVEVGLVLLVAVLCSVVHTPAYVAECGVAALGRSVTEVPALETSDEAVLVDRWRATKGGQVAYRVASLAVVAVRTGDREAVLFELDIAFLLDLAQPLLVGQVEPGLRVLLLLLLLLLLLVVVVLAVAIVLVSRVFRRPLVGRTTTESLTV